MAAAKAKPLSDAETLRWAGALGHTFVVEYAGKNPRVYNQYEASKWREVKLPPAVIEKAR